MDKSQSSPLCNYCGLLDWTVRKYGRVTHKQACPHRTDPWHQGDPKASAAYTNVPSLLRKYADRTTGYIYADEVAVLRAAADEIERQAAILDDLCDWAQHVAAPEDDAIHSIVERAEAALTGEPDA